MFGKDCRSSTSLLIQRHYGTKFAIHVMNLDRGNSLKLEQNSTEGNFACLYDTDLTIKSMAQSGLIYHVQTQRSPVRSEKPERFNIWSGHKHDDLGFHFVGLMS